VDIDVSHSGKALDELDLFIVNVFVFAVMERRRYYRNVIALFGE
jgi:hypothetical protein